MAQIPTLLLQVAVILVVARVVGMIFRRFHQPQVVGEMVAGLMLGPSLLGWLAPHVSAFLFPATSGHRTRCRVSWLRLSPSRVRSRS